MGRFFLSPPNKHIIDPMDIICQKGMRLLVFPWSQKGSLMDYLITRTSPAFSASSLNSKTLKDSFCDTNHRLDLAAQVAMGLRHLHNQSPPIHHLSLCPRNVLIFLEYPGKAVVAKLTDYAVSGRWVKQDNLHNKGDKWVRIYAPSPWHPPFIESSGRHPKINVEGEAVKTSNSPSLSNIDMDVRALGLLTIWLLARQERNQSFLPSVSRAAVAENNSISLNPILSQNFERIQHSIGKDFHSACLISGLKKTQLLHPRVTDRPLPSASYLASLLKNCAPHMPSVTAKEKLSNEHYFHDNKIARTHFYAIFSHFLLCDPDDSLLALKRSAGKGYPRAQYALGCLLSRKGQYEEAAKWLKRAGDQGDRDAQFNYACALLEGRGVQTNKKKACEWFQRSNTTKAIYNLQIGNHVLTNFVAAKSLKLYERAAQSHHAKAQFALARYHDGRMSGKNIILDNDGTQHRLKGLGHRHHQILPPRDPAKAVSLYAQAGSSGHKTAQYYLALRLLEGGDKLDRDIKSAITWLRRASKSSDGIKGHSGACYKLAWCYEHGIGVALDDLQALHWYLESAKGGDVRAQLFLADYYKSVGNTSKAEEWKKRSLSCCDPEAFFDYAKSLKSKENSKAAFSAFANYNRAAEMGHRDAQRMVGECFDTGYGTYENKDQAKRWYTMAANKGDKRASSYLSKLQNSRTVSVLNITEMLSDSPEVQVKGLWKRITMFLELQNLGRTLK